MTAAEKALRELESNSLVLIEGSAGKAAVIEVGK